MTVLERTYLQKLNPEQEKLKKDNYEKESYETKEIRIMILERESLEITGAGAI